MSTPSALRSRSRSRSNDGAVGRLRPAASGGGSDISEAVAGFNILDKVASFQLELEELMHEFGSSLRQVASKISVTDDSEIIELGLIALQTRLRRQLRQLEKVLSMADDHEKIAFETNNLCSTSA